MASSQSSSQSRSATEEQDRNGRIAIAAVPSTPPNSPERRKRDRFGGMSEEEVLKRTLPDYLADNLDIVIIGINPSLASAFKGHYYSGPHNHMWECLHRSGLTNELLTSDDDLKLMQSGIGLTSIVERATRSSSDLKSKELQEGGEILRKKLQKFRPKIAVFNGKLIYQVFAKKKEFHFGLQPECVDGTETRMWVMPSSSARCAQLPKASDKVPYYKALKKLRDSLNDGTVSTLDEDDVVFPDSKLKSFKRETQPKKKRKKNNRKREDDEEETEDEE